jgi:HEPN domain-containing protein
MNDQQPPEVTQGWLERARSDLTLGKIALKTQGVLPEDACFHAQQCAEKALKALLSQLGIPFPRTHAVELLLDLLKENGVVLPKTIDEAFALSQYAVQTRYPGEWEPVTKAEAKRALDLAAVVLLWVEGKIDKMDSG